MLIPFTPTMSPAGPTPRKTASKMRGKLHTQISSLQCHLNGRKLQEPKFQQYGQSELRHLQSVSHSVLLPGKPHRWRSLVGCSPWGGEESYTTERLHFHFSLSCIGEGNGNPLQYSCLENPRDGEPGRLPSVGSHRVGHD